MDLALINAMPFAIALLFAIPALRTLLPKNVRAWAAAGTMALLFAALIGYFPFVQEAEAAKEAVTRSITWVPELGMTLSFYLDGLSLLFGLVVTGIGMGVFLYAGYYFEEDEEQRRFLTLLMAFAGAMLGLVISGNLLTLFVMWELTSITSFLLIGFKGEKAESARFGAMQALWVTGAGALALIVGIVLLGSAAGQISGTGDFIFELTTILKLDAAEVAAHPYYLAFAVLIMLGAFTKSAQFPFHFWLPGAMDAPTPASAYLHSATMVKAGIYLLARLYPPLHDHGFWTAALVGIGLGTMFIGALFAITKRDLKGVLAYTTISKLGAIVAMIGLPEYAGIKAAFVGILAHALYKAALFLVVGAIDHNTGTRIIDKLGGLRRQMPAMMVITVISALSMAGIPFLFGFVAKETMLDAFLHEHLWGSQITTAVVSIASIFMMIAALILIWDVFFKEPQEEIHYHAAPVWLTVGTGIMAVGSLLFGFLLQPLIVPLLEVAVPKEFELVLFHGINEAFILSMIIIGTGTLLFLVRGAWMPLVTRPLIPSGTALYRGLNRTLDFIGDQLLYSQNGHIRYYLVVILGTTALVILGTGLLTDLGLSREALAQLDLTPSSSELLKAILVVLIIGAGLFSIFVRQHLLAALAMGVIGYAVGGLFLLEPAPDVALVQFLVETLGTVLIVVMLGRISAKQRSQAMARLWRGRSMVGNVNMGIFRDVAIAGVTGLTVFLFTLTALVNRPAPDEFLPGTFCDMEVITAADLSRNSISRYHLCNTEKDLKVTDTVGAIVSDYRGQDTLIEIAVFATAALGVLTLLSRGLQTENPLAPKDAYTQGEFEQDVLSELQDATRMKTPFTQMVARLFLPMVFVIALAHLIIGSSAPGDGFTAGAIAGLATALWYVIFGYEEAHSRLRIFAPHRLLRIGLLVAFGNALLPILLGEPFLGYIPYDQLLGISEFLDRFHLKFTSTLLYEIGIALTVFGGVGVIIEMIARPVESESFDTPAA